jgi:cysteine synthase
MIALLTHCVLDRGEIKKEITVEATSGNTLAMVASVWFDMTLIMPDT